jgi:hypothetical protein
LKRFCFIQTFTNDIYISLTLDTSRKFLYAYSCSRITIYFLVLISLYSPCITYILLIVLTTRLRTQYRILTLVLISLYHSIIYFLVLIILLFQHISHHRTLGDLSFHHYIFLVIINRFYYRTAARHFTFVFVLFYSKTV